MHQVEHYIDLAFDIMVFVIGLSCIIIGATNAQQIHTTVFNIAYNTDDITYSTIETDTTYSGEEVISYLLGDDTAVKVSYGGVSYNEPLALLSHIDAGKKYKVERVYNDANALTELKISEVN